MTEAEFSTYKILFSKWDTLPNVLYFGPEKCLKEFRITCWTCFEKASLVHFQIVRKGKFGPDSEKNLDQTCLFEKFESGPNLPLDT